MKPGTLVFYPSTNNIADETIRIWTHGPFVHVAIVDEFGALIEATVKGTVRSPLPEEISLVIYEPTVLPSATGFNWLYQQVGSRYNWADIAFDALPHFFRYGINIVHCFDCSELAVRFYVHGGLGDLFPSEFVDNPCTATPNDLARALGLIHGNS